MKKSFLSFILTIGFLVFLTPKVLKCQNPPCMSEYNSLTFAVENIDHTPPITMSMPCDVILGYLALDTITRYSNYNDVKAFLERQSYNDTMRYIMKYFYKMVDYDPLKYFLNLYFKPQPNVYHLFPPEVEKYVLQNIERVSPNPFLDGMLCKSSIISHILVTDTIRRIDTSSVLYPTAIIVTSQILDTIKGMVVPQCNDYYNQYLTKKKHNNNNLKENSSLSNNCLQFEYRLNWERGNEYSGLRLVDSLGNSWIKKNSEYIVFLRYGAICGDSSITYIDLSSSIKKSLTCTMYPIINGIVQDPDNEFGFGTGLTVDAFKTKLRNRISQITNYNRN